MDYRTLGHSGCAVSSLGTMTFGVEADETVAEDRGTSMAEVAVAWVTRAAAYC